MCYAFVSNKKPTSTPSNQAPVPGSRHHRDGGIMMIPPVR